MVRKLVLSTLFVLGVVIASAAPARADISIQAGNIPQTDENVLLNTGISGNPIFGTTNQTGLTIRFASDEPITAPASGQARIEAVDGEFTTLTVSVGASFPPEGTFTSLILNLDATADGSVDFSVVEDDGTINLFNDLALSGSGQNFFTIVASNSQLISSVTFTADVPVEFADAAQFRIGGAVIPEPASLALLGLGGALLLIRRRRAIV